MTPLRTLTAAEVAAHVGGELVGTSNVRLAGVASLEEAGPGDLSFLASPSYVPYFHATHAGAVLMAPEFRGLSTGPATRIIVDDPRGAVQRILAELAPPPEDAWGVHATAVIGRDCRWDSPVAIGPYAILGRGVQLGARCRIGPHVAIGARAALGDDCRLDAHAVVGEDAVLGGRVVLKAGARVGTAGFAFVERDGEHVRVPHVGGCRVEDDVEVGANATIDRGSVGTTIVGAGTKIDNLVHIAHNVRIGARCLLLAQAGIAGTTIIGNDVVIAGQAGLAGQLTVGDRARIAAQAGVIGDVPADTTVSGYPARDHRAVLRQTAALRRLTPLVASLERLAADHGTTE